jgi:transcriptional antiterminator RfaH
VARLAPTIAPMWIVARSQPHREVYAAANASRSGFAVFLPRVIEFVGHGDQRVAIARPLFPCYLFVESIDGRWRSLLSTYGISSVVMQGDAPGELPAKAVEQLRRRTDQDGFVTLPRRQVGDPVKIRGQGPFGGQIGVYQGMTAKNRCRVLLSLLGGRPATTLVAERDIVDAA